MRVEFHDGVAQFDVNGDVTPVTVAIQSDGMTDTELCLLGLVIIQSLHVEALRLAFEGKPKLDQAGVDRALQAVRTFFPEREIEAHAVGERSGSSH